LAQLHFAPTPIAASRLRLEGIPAERIFVTGNTVIDALLHMRARLAPAARFDGVGRLVLLTMHRRESFGGPIEDVCLAVRDLVERNPEVRVLFPVHLSPFVREPVQRLLSNHPRVRLVEPLSYRDLVQALVDCTFVLTDSGGIQEEGPALGKPVLVLRETTERPEAVTSGTAMLVGTDRSRVLEMSERLLHDDGFYHSMATATNPYGDGLAARRIVSALRQHFGLTGESLAAFTPALASDAPELQVVPGRIRQSEEDADEVLAARTP
jgi:UDP-N-acetylglucosamine 2-epimerase (non-hydrolysing)